MSTTPYRPSNILFLKGIALTDIEDDSIFDDKFTEGIESDQNLPISESLCNIPTKFTTWKDWIKRTNLICWSCDRKFKTLPLFIVDSVSDVGEQRIIVPLGNFCSDNCIMSYINIEYSGTERDNKIKYMLMLRAERIGVRSIIIPNAPKKTLRREYCGDVGLNHTQYQQLFDQIVSESTIDH